MSEKLDLRGLLCPEPVLATKRAFDQKNPDSIEALVDDEVCVSNLQRLAKSLKADCSVSQMQDHFLVCIHRTGTRAASEEKRQADRVTAGAEEISERQNLKSLVLFISKDYFGEGDEDFSRTLLNVFLQSMKEGGHRIRAILLANSGVKLMAKDSGARKVLEDFAKDGIEVLFCGLCVEYYGLKEAIPKEQITNMFAICEYLNAADKIIQL